MHCCKWLCGGILGAVVGGAAWVAIELLTNSEFGWIAWIVGLLVGLGVHLAASADQRGGFLRGAVAALLALAAVIGAKVSLAQIMTYQAAKAAQPAAVHDVSQPAGSEAPSDGDTGGETLDLPMVVPEETGREGLLGSTKESSIKDMDMVWLCLGAITAYIVGKGAGPNTLPSDESPSERTPKDQENRHQGGSQTGEPARGKEEETPDEAVAE